MSYEIENTAPLDSRFTREVLRIPCLRSLCNETKFRNDPVCKIGRCRRSRSHAHNFDRVFFCLILSCRLEKFFRREKNVVDDSFKKPEPEERKEKNLIVFFFYDEL